MSRKLIQKDTGMEITIDDRQHYGKDRIIINRLVHEFGFIDYKTESNLDGGLFSTKFKQGNDPVKLLDNIQWTELTIDGGNITTDMVTFKRLIDLCDNNKIKLIIINCNINVNVGTK